MVGETCPFSESDDPESVGNSTFSSMTTEEEGAEATWPRHFSKYSSQSFIDPTNIALQLAIDWTIRGHNLATMLSPLLAISLSTQLKKHISGCTPLLQEQNQLFIVLMISILSNYTSPHYVKFNVAAILYYTIIIPSGQPTGNS